MGRMVFILRLFDECGDDVDKIDIKSLTLQELTEQVISLGEARFRAKQNYQWLHVKHVSTIAEMTNISTKFQQVLDGTFYINSLKIAKKLVSKLDHTVKYLYELRDGEFVECVLMDYHHGTSICISSQVGCKMGCTFCASTIAGFVRNLTPSEMLDQIYTASRESARKIASVVLMGIGEPLDNFENVLRFLELLSDENGMNLSLRHVSLSTCGLVDRIYELAEQKLGLTLSISLHAPNDEIRSRTMPVNRRYSIDELLTACRDYTQVTHRRISFEYALIRGINDSETCAKELANRLRGMLCHVNLIPVNAVKETGYTATVPANVYRFQNLLISLGINATVRRTLGADIQAACGQLRRNQHKTEEVNQ